MRLTHEQHEKIKKLMLEKIEVYGMTKAYVSRKISLSHNAVSRYLNGRLKLSANNVCKIFKLLNIDFSSFQQEKKDKFVIKKDGRYYAGKRNNRYYSFGWQMLWCDVYEVKQSRAWIFNRFDKAQHIAKQIDGKVVQLV